MAHSSLATYVKISPHRNSPRNHAIDMVAIHCMAGPLSAATCGAVFQTSSASSNYGIGPDGTIGVYVEEEDRSWATSNRAVDNRAITIEVASDRTEPFSVTDAAYKALINLLVDICKRHPGIGELRWKGDKSLVGLKPDGTIDPQLDKQNMVVHRWFAAKSCPGDYLYNRHGKIADEVNAILKGKPVTESATKFEYTETPANFQVKIISDDGLNIRKYPSADNSVSPVQGILSKGATIYTIVATSGSWGKLKSGAGWINVSDKYVERVGATSAAKPAETKVETPKKEEPKVPTFTEEPANFQVTVEVATLNVRKYPSADNTISPILSTLSKGNTRYTIVATSGAWGKLKSGAGWINVSEKYCKRVEAKPAVVLPTFTKNKKYTLTAELRVFTGPSIKSAVKNHRQLSAAGQKSDKDKDGALDIGTVVTCKSTVVEGTTVWMQIPSGYISAFYDGKTYVK